MNWDDRAICRTNGHAWETTYRADGTTVTCVTCGMVRRGDAEARTYTPPEPTPTDLANDLLALREELLSPDVTDDLLSLRAELRKEA